MKTKQKIEKNILSFSSSSSKKFPLTVTHSNSQRETQEMAFSSAKLTELPPDLLLSATLSLPRSNNNNNKTRRFSLLLFKPLSCSLRSTEQLLLPKTILPNTAKILLPTPHQFKQCTSNTESNSGEQDQCVNDLLQQQLLPRLELWYLWSSLQKYPTSKPDLVSSKTADDVVALAREALLASKEAAAIVTDAKLQKVHTEKSSTLTISSNPPMKRIVRSTRLLKRQTKRRSAPIPTIEIRENNKNCTKPEPRKKYDERFDATDPLRLFLRGPETTQLLTAKEEAELIVNIQELMRLRVVKTRLQSQFCHEPTIVEWAAALGISCQTLKSHIHSGDNSRDKLIYANFRMVVHIAKQYQGRGLSLQDLLQEGSMGLMRSVEKFKPQAGCRFATYAYWWIRQAIRKALFQHSRTIRLPENIYALLAKVYEAKKLCIQKGNHYPTKEDIAAGVGITVERLDKVLYTARMPISMQQPIWMDQDTTFQEVTADNAVEAPDMCVAKKLMRQHVRNLLGVLNPRERKIIRSRFGMEDGEQKTLSAIGLGFGLSKERVRQLESRALYKLRQCLSSQGLEAYSDMLI